MTPPRSAASAPVQFDPLDPRAAADPFATLAELRRTAPVVETAPGCVFVASDAICREVLRDVTRFSSAGNFQIEDSGEPDPPTIAQLDPPRHGLFRRLVSSGLNPRSVAAAEPYIRDTAAALFESISDRGAADLVAALAQPLPARVIAHLIGVDDSDAPDFTRWTAEITSRVPQPFHDLPAWHEFSAYIESLIAARRASTSPPDDMITRLLLAEEEGHRLDDGEIRMAVFQFIVAGNDTATRLIGNVTHSLLQRPELWRRALTDQSAMAAAIEESLRHDSPIQWVMRRCTADTELAGTRISGGARVLVGLASANRDEQVWDDADEFSLERSDSGEKHLALGFGRHYCLGAPLGRLEASIALETLCQRLPTLRLADGFSPEYTESAMMRGLRRLDVSWQPGIG